MFHDWFLSVSIFGSSICSIYSFVETSSLTSENERRVLLTYDIIFEYMQENGTLRILLTSPVLQSHPIDVIGRVDEGDTGICWGGGDGIALQRP